VFLSFQTGGSVTFAQRLQKIGSFAGLREDPEKAQQLQAQKSTSFEVGKRLVKLFEEGGVNREGEPADEKARQAKNEIRKFAIVLKFLLKRKFQKFLMTYQPIIDEEDGDGAGSNFLKAAKAAERRKRKGKRPKNALASLYGAKSHYSPDEEAKLKQQSTVLDPSADAKHIEMQELKSPSFRRPTTVHDDAKKKFDDLFPHYRKFVPEEMEKLETAAIQKMFNKAMQFKMKNNEHATFPAGVRVSDMEKKSFKRLMHFLYFYSTTTNAGILPEEKDFAAQMHEQLHFLRTVEARTASRRVKGFVSKVDNIITILLYRERTGNGDCPVPEVRSPFDGPAEDLNLEALEMQGNREKLQEYSQQLKTSKFKSQELKTDLDKESSKQRKLQVAIEKIRGGAEEEHKAEYTNFLIEYLKNRYWGSIFGIFQLLLILLGLAFIWGNWNSTAWDLLEADMLKLVHETESSQRIVATNMLGAGAILAGYTTVAQLTGDFDMGPLGDNLTTDYQSLDRNLITLMEQFSDSGVDAIYAATRYGEMVGAFWVDGANGTRRIQLRGRSSGISTLVCGEKLGFCKRNSSLSASANYYNCRLTLTQAMNDSCFNYNEDAWWNGDIVYSQFERVQSTDPTIRERDLNTKAVRTIDYDPRLRSWWSDATAKRRFYYKTSGCYNVQGGTVTPDLTLTKSRATTTPVTSWKIVLTGSLDVTTSTVSDTVLELPPGFNPNVTATCQATSRSSPTTTFTVSITKPTTGFYNGLLTLFGVGTGTYDIAATCTFITLDPYYTPDSQGRTCAGYTFDASYGQVAWSTPYVFSDGVTLGITRARRLSNDNGEVIAVFAVDYKLSNVNKRIQSIPIPPGGTSFLLKVEGDMFASSDPAVNSTYKINGSTTIYVYKGVESTVQSISYPSTYLTKYVGYTNMVSDETGQVELATRKRPVAFSARRFQVAGIDLVSVGVIDLDGFDTTMKNNNIAAASIFLICFGLATFLALMASYTWPRNESEVVDEKPKEGAAVLSDASHHDQKKDEKSPEKIPELPEKISEKIPEKIPEETSDKVPSPTVGGEEAMLSPTGSGEEEDIHTKEPIPEEEDDDGFFKPLLLVGKTRLLFIVQGGFIAKLAGILIVVAFFVLWLNWANDMTKNIDHDTDQLVTETFVKLDDTVRAFMDNPKIAVNASVQRAIRGDFGTSSTLLTPDAAEINSRDEWFQGLIEAYATTVGAYGIFETGMVATTGEVSSAGICFNENAYERCGTYRPPGANGICADSFVAGTGPNGTQISQDCVNDYTSFDWYKQTVATMAWTWGRVYAIPRPFNDTYKGDLLVRLSVPFYLPGTTTLGGVFYALVNLTQVSEFLDNYIELGSPGSARSILIEPTSSGDIIASSTLETVLERRGVLFPFACEETIDDSLKATCHYLSLWPYGLNANPPFDRVKVLPTRLKRSTAAPLTYISRIPLTFGLEWIVVVTANNGDFYGAVTNSKTEMAILTFATLSVIAYLVGSGLKIYGQVVGKLQERVKAPHEETLNALEGESVSKETLEALLRTDLGAGHTFKEIVMEASGKTWRRLNNDDIEAKIPVDFPETISFAQQRALDHVLDTMDGVNILSKCHLETLENAIPLSIYNFLEADWYEFAVVQTAIVVHILLYFWEPATLDDLQAHGPVVWTVVVEALCLVVEITNILALMMVKNYWRATNFLDFKNSASKDAAICVLLFLTLLDWFLAVCIWYSFEYYFPLRIWILALMNSRVAKAGEILIRTIIGGQQVYALYLSFILIAAVTGLLLFRGLVNEEATVNNFENFVNSLITSYVFISTGENYNDIVYPAYEKSAPYLLWFFIFTVVGMLFIIGIVIEAFADAFGELQNEDLKNTYLFSRTGAVAAFCLLDLDESMSLSGGEMAGFLEALARHFELELKQYQMIEIFHKVDKDFDGVVTIFEFVHGVEEVLDHVETTKLQLDAPDRDTVQYRLVQLSASSWFRRILFLMVLINMWAFCLYGVGDERFLNNLNVGLLFVSIGEQIIRVSATGGITLYWNHASYYEKAVEQQWSNRVELVVLVIALLGWIIFKALDVYNLELFFLSLPIIRLLTFNETVRHLMWCLILIIPMFLNLLILLCLLVLWFALIGVTLFNFEFDPLVWEDDGSAPDGTFNDLPAALLTLFQLVGVGGTEVMYAAVNVLGWGVSAYFIVYTIILRLLFLNLFIGMILSMFGLAKPMNNPTAKDIMKKRLELTLFTQQEGEGEEGEGEEGKAEG